jgi:hypothetical protein
MCPAPVSARPFLVLDKGHMVATELERRVWATCPALGHWVRDGDPAAKEYHRYTEGGGTHQSAFEAGMLRFLRSQVEQNARRLKVATGANSTGEIEKDERHPAGSDGSVDRSPPEPPCQASKQFEWARRRSSDFRLQHQQASLKSARRLWRRRSSALVRPATR